MRIRIQLSLLIFIVVLAGINCNAPRNNPLDPLNPDYNYGSIIGTVQTTGSPSSGISDVNIFWEKANLNTQTDLNGAFSLNNIPIENGNIIFSKAGFKSDTIFVVWGDSKRFITLTFLNGIPTLDTVSIYTVVENRHSQEPESKLVVNAWMTDLDDDVDSVFVMNENLNLRKPLLFSQVEGNYQAGILESELNVNDIEQTIGLDFNIVAKEDSSNEFIIGSERVTRVIKDEVTGLFPSTDSSIVDTLQPVMFKWNRFLAGYNFNYLIEVYFLPSFSSPQLIHTETNIPSDSISFTLSQNLSNGNYFWVIWIIDEYQNRSRTRPVAFRIIPSESP